MKKVYLAGPLFTDGEMKQRREESEKLRSLGYEVYSPLEQNDEIGFDIDELYRRDIKAMNWADIAVLCIDNYDSGTMAELGWFIAKEKPVFSVWSNWKFEEPDNLFIRGLALDNTNKMFKSLDKLYEFLETYK